MEMFPGAQVRLRSPATCAPPHCGVSGAAAAWILHSVRNAAGAAAAAAGALLRRRLTCATASPPQQWLPSDDVVACCDRGAASCTALRRCCRCATAFNSHDDAVWRCGGGAWAAATAPTAAADASSDTAVRCQLYGHAFWRQYHARRCVCECVAECGGPVLTPASAQLRPRTAGLVHPHPLL